jgi:hypothetical protein
LPQTGKVVVIVATGAEDASCGVCLDHNCNAVDLRRPLLTWRHSAADVAHRAAPSKLAKSQRSAPNSEIPSRGPKNKNNPAVQAWINQQTLMAVHY